jgi:site-specific DNA-methyltransferase (adenine-specific)
LINSIRNEDCLILLSKIPSNSIDLCFYDPPYFQIISEKWDNQWKDEEEYLKWCNQWMIETVRVMKQSSSLYVCGTTKTNTFLKFKLQTEDRHPELTYQNEIIWCYNWGGRRKDHFARKHENIWVWSKGKKAIFYPDPIRIPYTLKNPMNKDYPLNPLGTVPVSWWQMQIVKTSKEKQQHSAQKPEKMLERIIKAHTLEEDTILDIFGGTFTTAVVAKKLKRNWISCDIDQKYCQIGQIRLKNWEEE